MGSSSERRKFFDMPTPGPVAFCRAKPKGMVPSDIRLLIYPDNGNWNDHAYRLRAKFGARGIDDAFEWLDGYLAFKDLNNNEHYFGALSDGAEDFIYANEARMPFASMLASAKDYLVFVTQLGNELASTVAENAHDIVWLTTAKKPVPEWEDFFGSDAFNLCLMRNSEQAFAFKNGHLILGGQRLDQEDARGDFAATVTLGGNTVTFDFTFANTGLIDKRRMAVLIGQNGTGKTASLVAISKALKERDQDGAMLEPFPLFNRVAVFAHSRALDQFDPVRQFRSGNQAIYSLDPGGEDDGLPFTAQIISMARGSEKIDEPLRRLNEVLHKHMPDISIMVPISHGGRTSSIYHDGKYWAPLSTYPVKANEQRRLMDVGVIDADRPLIVLDRELNPRDLSLGQRTFVSFAIQAIHAALPASIFLIDEPENFLHPNLLSQFIRLLTDILDLTQSIAIVSTHSPFLVREVHQDQVHVLSRDDDGGVDVTKPRLKTLGANVADISGDIFGDDLVDHLFQERVAWLKLRVDNDDQLLGMLKDELSLEALMRVRALISTSSPPDAPDLLKTI